MRGGGYDLIHSSLSLSCTMPPRRAPPPPPPPPPSGGLTLRTAALWLVFFVPLTAGLVTWAGHARVTTVAGAGIACSAAAGAAVETALASLLVGRRDLALASSGGRVLGHSALVDGSANLHPQADQLLLSPPPSGVALPGRCLPLAGSSGGWVEIALRTPAPAPHPTSPHDTRDWVPPPPFFVTSVTLEAPPPALSFPEGKAALPAVLSVSLATRKGAGGGWEWTEAGEAMYNASAAAGSVARLAQTSLLQAPGPARAVRLRVVANGGGESGTCLYRVRVHGEE